MSREPTSIVNLVLQPPTSKTHDGATVGVAAAAYSAIAPYTWYCIPTATDSDPN
jgi:hypothetical protein